MKELSQIFALNKTLSKRTEAILVYSQISVVILAWFIIPVTFLPTPTQALHAAGVLWRKGLGVELMTSFKLNLEAVALSTIISMVLAYSTVIPFFRPIVAFISKLRFLSMVGLTFVFTLMASGAHSLKLSLLVFSICVFFITSMADVINSIEREQFDLARTLRMKEWQVVWEVIVLGQIDKVFDVVRQNAAIGWLMLTMVEGIARSEGGIGAILLNQNKYFRLDAILAIQLIILAIGLGQDYGFAVMKNMFCPYSSLTTKK
jgi:NitT/TauT family transport system permease protein